MKRVITATCLAASFAVGLAAQSTGTAGTAGTTGTAGATAPDPQAGSQRGGGPRTVTGCLRAGDTAGSFTLTDVTMQGAGGGAGATAGGGATAGATKGGTTAGTATGGATGTGTAATGGQARPPMSINLTAESSVDLKPHVGHKVEVTGTMAGGRPGGASGAGTTGTATGTTAGGTTAGTGTAGAGTATGTGTGSTSGTGTAGATGTGQGARPMGMRTMTVTSVRMIAESCS
jgi:hypothetical protein